MDFMKLTASIVKILGLICSIIGITVIITDYKRRKRCTEVTDGIVDNIVKKRLRKNIYYYPNFCYYVRGQKYVLKYRRGTMYPHKTQFYEGAKVKIHYNPQNITESYPENGKNNVILGIILFFIGIIWITCKIS